MGSGAKVRIQTGSECGSFGGWKWASPSSRIWLCGAAQRADPNVQ